MSAKLWAPDPSGIAAAASALASGGVIGFPTDTVYGLAAAAGDPAAMAAVSRIKGRPDSQPLILMACSIDQVADYAILKPLAVELAQRFWPGPLTLILPSLSGAPTLCGEGTVGVRVPGHQVALALLTLSGPLATTSANRHGRPPAAGAASALAELAGLAGALADHPGAGGGLEPSSILDLSQEVPVLLRAGRLGARELGIPLIRDGSGSRRD